MTTFDLEAPNPNPGDALRDEAANLLSVRYGRPVREYRACGKKVDVFFKRRDFGKDVCIFVEAKDYGGNLLREHVVNIWSDYSGIIDKNKPAQLLLITRNGLSSDAQAYVRDEQSSMRHMTIWELENEILGLTDYIKSLSGIFDQGNLSAYYVPGQGCAISYGPTDARTVSEEHVPMFEEIMSWMEGGDPRPIAILGGYGAGKTSLAKRVISAVAREALLNPLARRPVLIRLGSLSRYSSLEGLLGGMFTHDFPVDGFNSHHFLEINKKGRLLIVLDGFDEMKHAMTWADFRSQIQDLNRLVDGAAKVILLGRPSAFVSSEEHFHVLRGVKRLDDGWRRLPGWPEFKEYDLQPFTAAERADFVKGYLRATNHNLSDAQIEARSFEVNQLADKDHGVFSKPVHAKILTDLAADPSVDLSRFAAGVSRWGLYEIFFGSLAEREMEKEVRRPIGELPRLEFLREIAFWLWSAKGGATSFSASDMPSDIIAQLPEGGAADIEAAKREYLTGAFIEKKSGDIYYFSHRSFAEFLVADRMLARKPSPNEQSIYSRLLRDGVLEFLTEAKRHDAVRAWADTLSVAQGVIHLDYISFIIDSFGGIDELVSALPKPSIWAPVLSVFDKGYISFDFPNIHGRVLSAMRAPGNVHFFLLHSLMQICEHVRGSENRKRLLPSAISAALLDRVFATATVEAASGKAWIEPIAEEARALAASVLPKIENRFGDRVILFRESALLYSKAECLRQAGVDLGFHDSEAFLARYEDNIVLPWSDVLKQMQPDAAAKATEYFRKADSLRGVFTRKQVPHRGRR